MLRLAQKSLVLIWLMFVILASIGLLFGLWNGNIFSFISIRNPDSFKVIGYSFLAGVLGSTVYACRGFYQSIAEPEASLKTFDFKWVFWYILRPLLGGIFGFVIYAFARAELTAFGLTMQSSGHNNLMFFALSFLAGFCFHDFAEYLTSKARGLFQKQGDDR